MVCSDYTQPLPCVLMPSISRLFAFFIYPCHVFVSVSLISPPTYFLSKKIYRLQMILFPTFFAHFWEEFTHIGEKCSYFGKKYSQFSSFRFSFIDFPFYAHMFSPSKSIWECHIARDPIWVSLYFFSISLSVFIYHHPQTTFISLHLYFLCVFTACLHFSLRKFLLPIKVVFSLSVSIISSRTWLVDLRGFIFLADLTFLNKLMAKLWNQRFFFMIIKKRKMLIFLIIRHFLDVFHVFLLL